MEYSNKKAMTRIDTLYVTERNKRSEESMSSTSAYAGARQTTMLSYEKF